MAMTATEIRKQMVVQVPQRTERQTLAEKASQLLHYGRLAQDERVGQLAKALGELDIWPLNQSDVEQYMKDMQEETYREKNRGKSFADVDVAWKTVHISRYEKPIPEFVLRKAVAVKEKLPKADIRVHELIEERLRFGVMNNRTLDPFLSVEFNGEFYYIEVWDEPKFEAKM